VEDEYFDELMQQLETVEEIQDAQEWVKGRYGEKLDEVRKNKEDEAEDGQAKKGSTKRVNRQNDYEGLKKSMIAKLADVSNRFSIPSKLKTHTAFECP